MGSYFILRSAALNLCSAPLNIYSSPLNLSSEPLNIIFDCKDNHFSRNYQTFGDKSKKSRSDIAAAPVREEIQIRLLFMKLDSYRIIIAWQHRILIIICNTFFILSITTVDNRSCGLVTYSLSVFVGVSSRCRGLKMLKPLKSGKGKKGTRG